MFKEIPDLLTADQVKALRDIAERVPFVDGRITNPHNKAKNNLQLHDQSAYEQSARLMMAAMTAHEDFRNFTFPVAIFPPMMTIYDPGMAYGAHADATFIQLPNRTTIRSDISCTIFLSDPADYEGGSLLIRLGTAELRFKGPPGSAIVYPSDTLHQVEPVTSGKRLVAISFIQSRIADPWRREMIYEINEVAALEGLKMDWENFSRLQLFREKLMRYWTDAP
jgi:PKHD-type hydroxylase